MPMIYEIPNNIYAFNLQEFMPYLFYPYDTTNGVHMILNDDAPLDDFYYDYRTKPYKPIRGNKCKKLVKH